MAKGKEFLISALTCLVSVGVVGGQAAFEISQSKTITDLVSEQNYTGNSTVKHDLSVMQKTNIGDIPVYTFNNIIEQTDTSISSSESGYVMKSVIQKAEEHDGLAMVQAWLSETAGLLTLFYGDISSLGIQKMQFYDGYTYTGILKYNGTIADRAAPVVSIYQIKDLDTVTYLETTCTNETATEYDWKQNELCLTDICQVLGLNYTSKDLGNLYNDDSTGLVDANTIEYGEYASEDLFVFDTKSGTIVSFDLDNPNAPTTVKIPPTINGVTVKAIGSEAFYNKFDMSKVRSVIIPDTVTHIGNNAFFANTALRSVTLPTNLIELGEGAFSGCIALKEIEIKGNVHEIKKNAFSGCRTLERVKLSESTETIGDNAFENCISLEVVDNVLNVSTIGAGAFKGTKVKADIFKADNIDKSAF